MSVTDSPRSSRSAQPARSAEAQPPTRPARPGYPLRAQRPAPSPRLRVLQVCARYLPDLGGIETHVDEVSRRLAGRDDLDVTVLATDRRPSFPRRETAGGITVLRVPAWPRGRDYYLAPGVFRAVRDGDWDLVHCQGVHTPVPALAMLAARSAGLPYLVTFHTGGHSQAYRNAMRSLQWRAMGPLLRGAAELVAVSRFEARVFVEKARVAPERITVIRNGGGLPAPAPGTVPVPGLIVSCGRLERYKGHHRVIEALAVVRRRMPDASLDILGAGPCAGELRELADSLGLGSAVRIRHIPPEDRTGMATALARASVVAAFSDYEAHPVAVMEALTAGRPVVGYDIAGIGDLVEDGLVRGIAPDTSAEDAAEVLVEQMRRAGGAVPGLPTWDTCSDDLVRVYHRVAAAAGRLR